MVLPTTTTDVRGEQHVIQIHPKNSEKRDNIIFGEELDWNEDPSQIAYFEDLEYEEVSELVDERFIQMGDSHNFSPQYGEFIELMERYEGITAHGYVVSPYREGTRVTIEGVSHDGKPEEVDLIMDFWEVAQTTDVCYIEDSGLYCWWD